MNRLRARRPVALIFCAVVAGTVIVSHELTISPRLQVGKVEEAAPGFSCADLTVETPSGSQQGRHRQMRSALRMPAACLSDLRERIRRDPRFHARRCNTVERCWTRVDGDKSYTFTFYPTYTSFRYEEG